jgi:phosphatidylserine/phosphatidylglycerophosphate/cardiolipin synthase-like enzyme
MNRRRTAAFVAAVCLVAVAGCTSASPARVRSPGGSRPAQASPRGGSGQFRLVQYPGAGFGGFYRQTEAASTSIDMEMYELADPTEERDLVAAAHRHVDVRVLLDSAYYGRSDNAAAYHYLAAHGVDVTWAPSSYILHIKATTFDNRTSDVSTANLTSRYYADTRDAEIIDTDPAQVAAIVDTFDRDWTGGAPRTNTVLAPGMVWSPDTGTRTAEEVMVNQIKAARRSVYFESEELSDAPVYDALAAAARRGVACQITMTNSSDWDTGFTAVTAAGCQVHVYPDSTKSLYIHEKLVLDDAGTGAQSLLIGSQNAGYDSLNRNRELGLLLTSAEAGPVIASVAATFRSDFAHAPPWH